MATTRRGDPVSDYRKGSVASADGTRIGYRQLGSGPGVIIVHGGMQAAQNFMRLANALSTEYTVTVPDRRGRGLSGPHGADFGILREVEDITALVAQTGAKRIFGLSSGALVALRTALATPELERVVLYEPPLSIGGGVPDAWTNRFDREIAEDKPGAALVTALKGIGVTPMFTRLPRFVLVPLITLGLRVGDTPKEDDVPIRDLVPTQHFDMRLVRDMADTTGDYSALRARVLLLGGSESPEFLASALDELTAVLPNVRRVTFPGLGHSGPDDSGDPERVAETIHDFFAAKTH